MTLDADLLGGGPGSLRYARDFASRRRPEAGRSHEPALRHREHADADGLARRSSASAVGRARSRTSPGASPQPSARLAGRGSGAASTTPGATAPWIDADRERSPRAPRQPASWSPETGNRAAVHALAHASTRRSETSAGRSSTPTRSRPTPSIRSSRSRISSPTCRPAASTALVIVGGNPVYTAPADIRLRGRPRTRSRSAFTSACTTMRRRRCATGTCPKRISSRPGATRAATTGPRRSSSRSSRRSTAAESAHELLAAMSDRPDRSGVRHRARPLAGASHERADFDLAWRRWLHDGVIPDTALRRDHGRRRARARRSARRRRRRPRAAGSRSHSATIRRCSTDDSPTTAGCRSCRSRSRGSRGTTPCS